MMERGEGGQGGEGTNRRCDGAELSGIHVSHAAPPSLVSVPSFAHPVPEHEFSLSGRSRSYSILCGWGIHFGEILAEEIPASSLKQVMVALI